MRIVEPLLACFGSDVFDGSSGDTHLHGNDPDRPSTVEHCEDLDTTSQAIDLCTLSQLQQLPREGGRQLGGLIHADGQGDPVIGAHVLGHVDAMLLVWGALDQLEGAVSSDDISDDLSRPSQRNGIGGVLGFELRVEIHGGNY